MLDGLAEESIYGAIDRSLQPNEPEIVQYEDLLLMQMLAAQKQHLIVILMSSRFLQKMSLQPRMFNWLRGLATQFPVQFVIASMEPLAKLTFANPAVVSSSFFNIFAPFRLSLFQEQEAIEMLISLSERSGAMFQTDTIDFLLELVGPHPHFLQVASYHAFELQSNGLLSAYARAAVKERTAKELEGHLEYYWRNLSAEEQYTLATLPQIDFDSYSPILAHLSDYGLLYEDAYLGSVLREFVTQQNVPGLLCHGPFVMDERRRCSREWEINPPHRQNLLCACCRRPGRLLTPKTLKPICGRMKSRQILSEQEAS
jgi:hypothetical protein